LGLTRSPAVPGNLYLEAVPRRLRRKTGGRASGSASPGRAGNEEYLLGLTGSPAVPGNRYLEALPRRLRRKTGGRASGAASPGRAWERENAC